MSISDFLIGNSSLKRQRDKAVDYARDTYDPSMFQPSINQASTQASEGIGQERRDIMRSRTVQSLFTPTDNASFRGNQASQLAGQQAQTQARQQALAGFESRLAEADIQVQQQGEQQVADLQSQQRQVQGQQDAAIDEADMMYEAEKSRRKQALAGAALGLVGNLVTTPFGPDMESLAGRGLEGLFGEDPPSDMPNSTGGNPWKPPTPVNEIEGRPELPQVDVASAFDIDTPIQQLRLENQNWQQQGSVVPMGSGGEVTNDTMPSREGLIPDIQSMMSSRQSEPEQTQEDPLQNLSRAVQSMDGVGDQTGLGELIFRGIQSGNFDPFRQYGNLQQLMLSPFAKERQRLSRAFE